MKILSYDGFIEMFNIDPKLVSGLFSLTNKALEDRDEF